MEWSIQTNRQTNRIFKIKPESYQNHDFPLPLPLSSCINDFETCDCIFKSDGFASLEEWFFDSMQFSGLADRSLEIGGGDGLHPNNFLTDSFNSGVLRGGRASVALIASFASLLLVVTERSSGWRRPSGDGGSSTLLPSTLDGSWTDSRVAPPTSGQPLPEISFSRAASLRLSKGIFCSEWTNDGEKDTRRWRVFSSLAGEEEEDWKESETFEKFKKRRFLREELENYLLIIFDLSGERQWWIRIRIRGSEK